VIRSVAWPTRDFVDPGLPAMFAASAAAQWLLGDTLYSEVVLVAVAFGVAAAFTMLAVRQLTESMILALLARSPKWRSCRAPTDTRSCCCTPLASG
jgi:hypothetical protein